MLCNPVFGNSPFFSPADSVFCKHNLYSNRFSYSASPLCSAAILSVCNVNKKTPFSPEKPEKFVVPKTAFCVPKTAKRRPKTAFSVPVFRLRRTFSASFIPKTHGNGLWRTRQKRPFRRAKVALLKAESGTFARQKRPFRIAKRPLLKTHVILL